jgi:hypothetical protein
MFQDEQTVTGLLSDGLVIPLTTLGNSVTPRDNMTILGIYAPETVEFYKENDRTNITACDLYAAVGNVDVQSAKKPMANQPSIKMVMVS